MPVRISGYKYCSFDLSRFDKISLITFHIHCTFINQIIFICVKINVNMRTSKFEVFLSLR